MAWQLICNDLTLYHTIPTFNDLKVEGFGKHQLFLLVPQCFLLYHREKLLLLVTFNLSFVSAFNLVTSKILSFSKDSTIYYAEKIVTGPSCKQTTNSLRFSWWHLYLKGWETLREKEKILVNNIFSFKYVFQGHLFQVPWLNTDF